jgi:DNA-binding Lrp family transcriptional regulator
MRHAATLDDIDRRIVNALQEGFPLSPRPYAEAAQRLGLSEDDLISRLKHLLEIRAITRFGPFLDAAAMGGAFCLCAMAVPSERFEAVMIQVNARPEVAHNYERAHRLNMWFVLAAETPEGIGQVAREIEGETGREFFVGFRVAA